MHTPSESIALLILIITARIRVRSSWFEILSLARSSSKFSRLVSRCDSTCRPSLLPPITDWRRSRRACNDSTLAPTGNLLRSALCGEESVTPTLPAKAVFILVFPFVSLGQGLCGHFHSAPTPKG